MPTAEWAAAEWAGWICKKDGRAQRVQTALISRRYAENSNWRRVLPRLRRDQRERGPPYSRQSLRPAEREAFLGVDEARDHDRSGGGAWGGPRRS